MLFFIFILFIINCQAKNQVVSFLGYCEELYPTIDNFINLQGVEIISLRVSRAVSYQQCDIMVTYSSNSSMILKEYTGEIFKFKLSSSPKISLNYLLLFLLLFPILLSTELS